MAVRCGKSSHNSCNPSLYWVVIIKNFNADHPNIHKVFLKYDTQGSVNCDRRRWDSHLPSICYGYSSLRSTTATFLGALVKLRKATSASSCLCLSVCLSAWNNSAPTGRIFIKFCYLNSFQTSVEKIQVHYILTWIKGTLHENLCTLMTVLRWILVRMRNVSYKSCRENQIVNFVPSRSSENRAVFGIM